jgi:cytoskeleton protein RodZ
MSLGQVVTEARERKGLTREQVVTEAHLPAHYIKMIETDSYGMISDQLYLVPFLRRYATFLGLDAEDVASRFVRDVQHAEASVVRISQDLKVVTKRTGIAGQIAIFAMAVAVLFLLADFAYRRFFDRHAENPAPVASPAAIAPETLPPATIVTNPEPAAAPSAPVVIAPVPAPQSTRDSAPPRAAPYAPRRAPAPPAIPRSATD